MDKTKQNSSPDFRDASNSAEKSNSSVILLFAMPVIIAAAGLITFFVLVPKVYGEAVSVLEWLFADPKKIFELMLEAKDALTNSTAAMILRIVWLLWLGTLIASLFFVGRWLHTRRQPVASNAALVAKDPYLMVQDIRDALLQVKNRVESKQLDSLLYSVSSLMPSTVSTVILFPVATISFDSLSEGSYSKEMVPTPSM